MKFKKIVGVTIFFSITFLISWDTKAYSTKENSIGNIFISTPKVLKAIRTDEDMQEFGKSGYFYCNDSFAIIYIEDVKKEPLVYRVKLWEKHFDSVSRQTQISLVHFNKKSDEDKFFQSYYRLRRNDISVYQPDILITIYLPQVINKSKSSCNISWSNPYSPFVNMESYLSNNRTAEMEGIIRAAKQKEAVLNSKIRKKIGDTFQGGVIVEIDKTGQHGIVCTMKDIANSISYYEAVSIADTFSLMKKKWRLPNFSEASAIDNFIHDSNITGAPLDTFKSFYYWIKDTYYKDGTAYHFSYRQTNISIGIWGTKYAGNKKNFDEDVGLRLVSDF